MTKIELRPGPRPRRGFLLVGLAAAMTTLGGCTVSPQRPPMPDMSRLVAVNTQLPAELQRRQELRAQSKPVEVDTNGFSFGLSPPAEVNTDLPSDLLRRVEPVVEPVPNRHGPRLSLYDGIDATPVVVAEHKEPRTAPAEVGVSADIQVTEGSGGRAMPPRDRDAAIAAVAEIWSRRELATASGGHESGLVAPVERWSMSRGDMLSEGLQEWADQAGWDLVWSSRVDYRIASRLSFSGALENAVEDLILLYSHSDKPLYADISPRQRLVVVSDDPRELGE